MEQQGKVREHPIPRIGEGVCHVDNWLLELVWERGEKKEKNETRRTITSAQDGIIFIVLFVRGL